MWLVFEYGSMTAKKQNGKQTHWEAKKASKAFYGYLWATSTIECKKLLQKLSPQCSVFISSQKIKLENNLAPLHITACELIIHNIAMSSVRTTFR